MTDKSWQLHVTLPEPIWQEARDAARREDRSLTAWVRRAIREKLERDAQQA